MATVTLALFCTLNTLINSVAASRITTRDITKPDTGLKSIDLYGLWQGFAASGTAVMLSTAAWKWQNRVLKERAKRAEEKMKTQRLLDGLNLSIGSTRFFEFRSDEQFAEEIRYSVKSRLAFSYSEALEFLEDVTRNVGHKFLNRANLLAVQDDKIRMLEQGAQLPLPDAEKEIVAKKLEKAKLLWEAHKTRMDFLATVNKVLQGRIKVIKSLISEDAYSCTSEFSRMTPEEANASLAELEELNPLAFKEVAQGQMAQPITRGRG